MFSTVAVFHLTTSTSTRTISFTTSSEEHHHKVEHKKRIGWIRSHRCGVLSLHQFKSTIMIISLMLSLCCISMAGGESIYTNKKDDVDSVTISTVSIPTTRSMVLSLKTIPPLSEEDPSRHVRSKVS